MLAGDSESIAMLKMLKIIMSALNMTIVIGYAGSTTLTWEWYKDTRTY